jgi:hypothetical protein
MKIQVFFVENTYMHIDVDELNKLLSTTRHTEVDEA